MKNSRWKLIRIAGFESDSIVDGPGLRFTLFVQGCPHHCAKCHNPETHDFTAGHFISIEEILQMIDKNSILDGVTFSGGEPICQAAELLPLAQEIKKRKLHLTVFTGFIFEKLLEKAKEDSALKELLALTDLLVDGPFIFAQKSLELKYRGSTNQRLIDLPKTLATNEIHLWKSKFDDL